MRAYKYLAAYVPDGWRQRIIWTFVPNSALEHEVLRTSRTACDLL